MTAAVGSRPRTTAARNGSGQPDVADVLLVNPQRGDLRLPEQISLSMEFAEQAGEGPTLYENRLYAALVGNGQRFARQDGVEECWRVMAPLIENPPPVVSYARGSYGPREAEALLAGHGRWRGPWVVS